MLGLDHNADNHDRRHTHPDDTDIAANLTCAANCGRPFNEGDNVSTLWPKILDIALEDNWEVNQYLVDKNTLWCYTHWDCPTPEGWAYADGNRVIHGRLHGD